MRKSFVLLILSILLLCALPVMAAGGGQATVTSAGGVAPGERITFTVSISGADNIRAAMLEPTYDSAAFELVSGAFLRTGTITDFSQGSGVIAWADPTDPNGAMLTFTLKAKSGVKTGTTYTVGCQYSVRDGNDELQYCTVVASTVTVTCSHSFTGQNTDGKYLCGQATCTSPAKYYYSCNQCGAAGTETFEHGQAKGHDFSAQSTDAQYAKVAATCKQSGEYYYSCAGCGLAGTKTFKTTAPGDHVYDHSCDTDCNECGQLRTTTHDYQWQGDETQHWQECTGCKDRQAAQNHTPGPAATETAPQKCTVCGKLLAPALAHVHEYAEAYAYDEFAHWNECSCGSVKNMQAHIWSEPQVVKEPTADVDGIRRRICEGCGMEQDEVIPKTGTAPIQEKKPDGKGIQILLWSMLSLSIVANGVLIFFVFKKKRQNHA